ncbi:MAG: helix-turn-helix domain-containing protein, partial [Alphaproteobacteria bacterium]|nr:helix-turn-helix domain-containing protein [Alphaproteobacteria bacterium]
MARSKIVLDAAESRELQRRVNATTVAVRDRQRAEIIMLSAAGISQGQIASRVGVSRATVNHWCQQFLTQRLAGLEDAA